MSVVSRVRSLIRVLTRKNVALASVIAFLAATALIGLVLFSMTTWQNIEESRARSLKGVQAERDAITSAIARCTKVAPSAPADSTVIAIGQECLAVPREWVRMGFWKLYSAAKNKQGVSTERIDQSNVDALKDPVFVADTVAYVTAYERRNALAPSFPKDLPHEIVLSGTTVELQESNTEWVKDRVAARPPSVAPDRFGFVPINRNELVHLASQARRPFGVPLVVHCVHLDPARASRDLCTVGYFSWKNTVAVRYSFNDDIYPQDRWVELDQSVLELLDMLRLDLTNGEP